MAHFAKLDDNNRVIDVYVVNNTELIDSQGIEREELGVEFLTKLFGHTLWKQTSYNGNFRKNYAGYNYTYDETRDAFIPPKDFPSWIFNESTCRWEAPVPIPEDHLVDKVYLWDETLSYWKDVSAGLPPP